MDKAYEQWMKMSEADAKRVLDAVGAVLRGGDRAEIALVRGRVAVLSSERKTRMTLGD